MTAVEVLLRLLSVVVGALTMLVVFVLVVAALTLAFRIGRPVPSFLLAGPLGPEWHSWLMLSGAERVSR